MQDIANQGLYHPSVNLSIAARVIVNYTPQDYPTDAQRSNGFICGCTNYYNNPCRAEFRKVPETDLSFPLKPTQCYWLRCALTIGCVSSLGISSPYAGKVSSHDMHQCSCPIPLTFLGEFTEGSTIIATTLGYDLSAVCMCRD